jgi:hypothetical protein
MRINQNLFQQIKLIASREGLSSAELIQQAMAALLVHLYEVEPSIINDQPYSIKLIGMLQPTATDETT